MDRIKSMKFQGDKIYRGAYSYLRNKNVYSEEQFEVYKNKQDLSMKFFIDTHSRVITGELLTISIDYFVSKDFIPQEVKISRTLGEQTVVEKYIHTPQKNSLTYSFDSGEEIIEKTILTAPIFHICVPAVATSMLYLKSKKEDTTGKNTYTVLQSYNQWQFDKVPHSRLLIVQRASSRPENLNIEGNNIQATPYKIFESDDISSLNDSCIYAYISKYATIPYMIRSDDGTKIQIKYLNNLDSDS